MQETGSTKREDIIDLTVEHYRSERGISKLVTTSPESEGEQNESDNESSDDCMFSRAEKDAQREEAQRHVLEQLTGIHKLPDSDEYPVLDMKQWMAKSFAERQRERHIWEIPFSAAHTMSDKMQYKSENPDRWRNQKVVFMAGGVITADYCPIVECERYREAF